ncbi:MAG: hypothetical protein K2Q33_06580 [Gammaproteobacteria bacterium]|nr:hypothetical protein [Gammaproteobacteria bacterium]
MSWPDKRFHLAAHIREVDPEYRILRVALLAAICVLMCIGIFQWSHQTALLGWAAFAALAFSQIDTLEIPRKRIIYLGGTTFIFAVLAWASISLGRYPLWFLLITPWVIFVCGYTIAFGNRYFIVGTWAAFLYVAFGSSLGDRFFAWHVALTFLGVGILCIVISLLFFPEKPGKRLCNSCIRILENCYLQIPHAEALLSLQNVLFQTYINVHTDKAAYMAYWQFHKGLYQLYLLQKQMRSIQDRTAQHISFEATKLATVPFHTQGLIKALINILECKADDLPEMNLFIQQYREAIRAIQIQACQQQNPDLAAILDYSSYLYHTIQIWNLLEFLVNPAKIIRDRNRV